MENKICCFFGHRKIKNTDKLEKMIYEHSEHLIKEKNIYTFLFGSKSQFDDLCHKIITMLKKTYPQIERIYVRAEYPYINDDYKNELLERYEDTYYPEKILNAGKSVYLERNYEMIDKSDFCIVYYDPNYQPPTRKSRKNDVIPYQPNSGTKMAYDYAVKKNKTVINLAE